MVSVPPHPRGWGATVIWEPSSLWGGGGGGGMDRWTKNSGSTPTPRFHKAVLVQGGGGGWQKA